MPESLRRHSRPANRLLLAICRWRTALPPASLFTLWLPIWLPALLLPALLWFSPPAAAQTAEVRLQRGQYAEAAEAAKSEIESGSVNERWPRLLMQAQLATGQYEAAIETFESAIVRSPFSFNLRLLAYEALLADGQERRANEELDRIFQILQLPARRFATADNLVATGRYFALRREDARQILQYFYDRVRAAEPSHVEAAIATAELALAKGDFQVAATNLDDAKHLAPGDPRIDYLMFRAYRPSDPARAAAALQAALERNPRFTPALLALADSAIDRERYEEAQQRISEALEVNPSDSQAWALRAVIAHLQGKPQVEEEMRQKALGKRESNPDVDHTIGRKLSQNYRFAVGAQYQRRALESDPGHPAARFQLAEDLLRLGQDTEGWQLARQVAEDDPYHVVAYNLVTLYDRLQRFATLSDDGIVVRMAPDEAVLYGPAVLELLAAARRQLCEKYQVEPAGVVAVEIFPQQQDFAIRTFGLPGGDGFLGVCFGRVITANSPASQGARPANWESVLWHEFCHAVTLEKTHNRMPRWLSEGLSVYEERQRDPASGEAIGPLYREMLLDESLTPVSQLSGAFLNPPTAMHLQFAYYQSSLVIEFLAQQYGFDAILTILDDLAGGMAINDALAKSTAPIDRLDEQFAAFARDLANQFGSQLDWSQDDVPHRLPLEQWKSWVAEYPDSYWGNRRWAEAAIAAERWQEAIEPLEFLGASGAWSGDRGGPLEQLTEVYAKLGRTDDEQRTLERLVSLSDDALAAHQRLAELAADAGRWDDVQIHSRRILAIQPLIASGHRLLALASERLDQPQLALPPLQALAALQPADPAAVEYRLARAYHQLGETEQATRHVIEALSEAPRYGEALELLLEIDAGYSPADAAVPAPPDAGNTLDEPSAD